MQAFNSGKKVFFLYPPQNFFKTIIKRIFKDGFEIYKLNSTENLLPLLQKFPDSVLFINTDYPYKDFNFTSFNDLDLHKKEYENLMVYSFFMEKVSYGDKILDYISLDRSDEEVYTDIYKILTEAQSHGKREFVRYGNYNEILSSILFNCNSDTYSTNMHDISPKALSFSTDEDLDKLVGSSFSNMRLKVGAYEINVKGVIGSSRMIADKKLYIANFETDEDKKEEIFDFIFTSLEKGMDEIIQSLS
ncbi:hypothetical protein [Oceanispirochaeta sp.]|uniref:hypothetical protein n=1 Tax=Oceanispirochaeta sp. TaxID=2035350 RepID=UPI00262F909B|nr:hypothetical protein [Oceanispirochaeta sp.]MDA3957542.1 hypothetical protein [Oceanispirochaeta sp.]